MLAKNSYKPDDLKNLSINFKSYRPRTVKVNVGGLALPLRFDLLSNIPMS